jgi:hypothetical protein
MWIGKRKGYPKALYIILNKMQKARNPFTLKRIQKILLQTGEQIL